MDLHLPVGRGRHILQARSGRGSRLARARGREQRRPRRGESGRLTESAWTQLAQAREKDHPQDAAAIYRNSIDGIIDHKHNRAYDEAVELAGKIKTLMARAGQKEEFAAWLEALRVKHKAKRNFMQRIEGLK